MEEKSPRHLGEICLFLLRGQLSRREREGFPSQKRGEERLSGQVAHGSGVTGAHLWHKSKIATNLQIGIAFGRNFVYNLPCTKMQTICDLQK